MNKKILATLLFAACSLMTLHAQQKGDKFIGTMVGFGIQKTSVEVNNGSGATTEEGDPIIQIGIDPGFHYFVADNFRLGLQMSLQRQSQKGEDYNGSEVKNSVGTFIVGPEAAYYAHLADRFYFTPEVGFYFAHSKVSEEISSTTESQKLNGFALSFTPLKFEFRPTEHFGIATSLINISFINLKKQDTDDFDVKSKSFGLNLGFNPSVGVHIYL